MAVNACCLTDLFRISWRSLTLFAPLKCEGHNVTLYLAETKMCYVRNSQRGAERAASTTLRTRQTLGEGRPQTFFEFKKKNCIVIVDYFLRWLDLKELSSTTSQTVIRVSCESDFRDFATGWGFTHVTSSPRYPQTNGESKRAVQTVENIWGKTANPFLGLLA